MDSHLRSLLLFLIFSSLLQVIYCNECGNTYHITEDESQTSEANCINVHLFENSTLVPYKNCINLSDFLITLNSLKCEIELVFNSGIYTLTGYNIIITNSINMTAAEPGVVINCEISEREVVEIRKQLWVNSTLSGYAVLSGISFQSCAYSLRFDYLERVKIDNCNFTDFKSSAVDIYNSLHIEVTNSQFRNNNVSTLNDKFRADAAGLSVAYNFPKVNLTQPTLLVEGCMFEDNIAEINEILSSQIAQVLNENVYPARGGGMGIIINEFNTNITVNIKGCVFRNNSALAFGGGLYIGIDGQGTNHSIFVTDSAFIQNNCTGGGGGILIGYNNANLNGVPSLVEVRDCLFDRNIADSSGGALVGQAHNLGSGNYAIFRRCNFTMNIGISEGSALVFGSLFNVQARRKFYASVIDGCNFIDNNSMGGTLIAGFTNIDFTGSSLFLNNYGPTLRATGCLLQIKGNVTFSGNVGDVLGSVAMYLSAFGQIKIYKNCHLTFNNNTGSIGAAIYVELQQFPMLYSSIVSNPLCFIQYEESTLPPIKWQPGLIHFSGNSALLGSAIYISYIDLCSHYSSNESDLSTLFDKTMFPKWPIFDFSNNTNTLHKYKEEDPRYYIQTPAFKINDEIYDNNEIKLRPGQEQDLQLTGLDQFGNPTFFISRIIDKDESLGSTLSDKLIVSESFEPPDDYSLLYFRNENMRVVRFDPSLLLVYPNETTNVTFDLELSISEEESGDGFVGSPSSMTKAVLVELQNSNGKTYDFLELNLTVLACQAGYNLRSTGSNIATCVCTGAEDNSFAVLDCDDDNEAIILRNGYWAGYDVDGKDEGGVPHLDIYPCPVPYCQCQSETILDSCIAKFFSKDTNTQCHPPREGPLCGTCGGNTTITILRFLCKENCEYQKYTLYYATVILIIVDSVIIILALLVSIKFGVHLPHSMKAILFYIQTVYIATEFFPIHFWDSRQYMLYLSNVLGLYFPVDFCFIPGAPTILSFIPRFIPSLLLFTISAVFLFAKRARIGMWHGVWLLVQVTYAPLVYTCVMLLHCPKLPDTEGNDDVIRWFLDGSIKCFHDLSHILLGTIAIIFLLGLVLLIPLVLCLVLFEWHPFIQEKYPILINVIKALKTGYQPRMKWWAVIDLLRRLLFIGIVVGLPGRSVSPVYVLAFFFALHLYFQPYKYRIQNTVEAIVVLNYIILFVLRFPQTLLDTLDEYTGTMVPSEYGQKIPSSFNVVIFYTLFFNIPIVIGVFVCVFWITHRIWRYYKKQLAKDKRNPGATDMDRYFVHDLVNVAGTQISSSDINDLQLNDEQ